MTVVLGSEIGASTRERGSEHGLEGIVCVYFDHLE